MNKPKIYCFCGLPCSGKSTKSKELAEKYNATIFSSDALREELFNDINEHNRNSELFNELHKRIKDCLKSGKNAIYDACNHHKRRGFFEEIKNIKCEKIAVLMATPYEMCLERSKNRDRQVPEYVIKRMYMSFEVPYWHEGWDDIWIEYAPGTKDSFDKAILFPDSVKDFSQDNPHHTLTLCEHCGKAYTYLVDKRLVNGEDISTELLYAALLHDNAKVFTKSFVNHKGEKTNIAHYYGHENPSAYDSLFYEYPADHLHVATLINWHMRPYLAWDKSEKAREKDKKLLGEELYNEIIQLHEADVYAH